MRSKLITIGVIIVLGLLLAACSASPPPAPTQPIAPAPAQACPSPQPCPTLPPPAETFKDIPFQSLWEGSAHAKKDAAAFTHWDTATPAEVPTTCAKCHSDAGFKDYVGADGSEAFKVDKAAPIGSVISCTTCHNDAAVKLSSVKFPSGAEIKGLGPEAICMTCHQGNASKATVDDAIKKANVTDLDTPVKDLGFTNIHYFAASVARYGTQVQGGYEYDGKAYDALWQHAGGVNKCQDCHDQHSLQVKVDVCQGCHTNVKTIDDVKNIRMMSSQLDFNGNGDVKEGIYYEIDGLRQMLYTAIQSYAKDVAGKAIAYSPDSYPYFFLDTNANGKLDTDEAKVPNAYSAWTARLAKAAYNYQMSIKDPGAFVHGGKYIIELLYDSIDDLNTKLPTKVDLSKAHRIDPGHFAGSQEAFRHWDGPDAGGIVPGGCAKCHAPLGLPQYLKEGTNVSMPAGDGMQCETCHNDLTKFTRYEVKSVKFPSGATVSFDKSPDSNLCLNCHQGRESSVSVSNAVKGLDADKPSDKLGFRNVHYFAAGATLFGTQVKGVYEYPGKTYAGAFQHEGNLNYCTACHDTHVLTPKLDTCKGCHATDDPKTIRMNSKADYNGNGDVKEGVYYEVEGLKAVLYQTIQAYATNVVKTSIVYSPASYPYFFIDKNANGQLDTDEADAKNAYNAWTPRLLEAAYNYQYSVKDPGVYVHNATYILQVLYDTIQDVNSKANAKLPTLIRP